MTGQRKQKVLIKRPAVANHVVLFVSLSIILLAFFILLNTFATYDEARAKKAIQSIDMQFVGIFERTRRAFEMFNQPMHEVTVSAAEGGAAGDDLLFSMLREQYDDLMRLGRYITDFGMGGRLGLHVTDRGLVITASSDLTFNEGSSQLTQEGRQFLNRLVELLEPFKNDLLIEGHTDSIVPEDADFGSNWELSQARAMSVLRYLNQQGIDMDRLSAAGAGQWRPIAEGDTPESRALNRRVEIIVTHPRYRTADAGNGIN
jgi:chemotaxis protein MotB